MQPEERNLIENVILDIMVNDGPDRRCDGADVLADFFEAYIDGKQNEWLDKYFSNKQRHFTIQ